MRELFHWLLLAACLTETAVIAADFPTPYNTEPDVGAGPMRPAEAAASFRLPPDFQVQVFASEPEVQNPIGMAWDGRGRLWVAENYTYAERAKKFELALRDRVVIFDDLDGDGRADDRRVFTDELQMLTSVEIGRGGVWLMCPPQLLFIPDADRNDIPDGPAQVMLDGFEVPTDNYHTIANGLKWGPDGWLYGRCGASSSGRIGTPGTPAVTRTPINGGVWRFHPTQRTFEVLAHGTTNPWGHDWNELGELFFINTVNGHLWHVFPGAHFRRPHTQDPNPRVYETIDMHADHWHWDTGQQWQDSRGATGKHGELGGGHAHSGCTIYQADQFPPEYRGRLFTLNLHGQRINVERLERSGSGYVGLHEPDIFHTADPWFRGIELGYGPDGGVFVLDWSDVGECHEHTGVHRESGRIYKITYGTPEVRQPLDLEAVPSVQLVDYLADTNEWYVRQARRILIDRSQAGAELGPVCSQLHERYAREESLQQKLRYLWTLYALDAATPDFLLQQLESENEHVRVWAVRLLTDHWPLDTILSQRPERSAMIDSNVWSSLVQRCEVETSDLVRLALTSVLQRVPSTYRAELSQAISESTVGTDDHNIPLLMWYGLIPLADDAPEQLVSVASGTKIRVVRRFAARRLCEELDRDPRNVNALLTAATDGSPEFRSDVLAGLVEGLAGWRRAKAPAVWQAFSSSFQPTGSGVSARQLRELSVLFGDGRALAEVRAIALDEEADLQHRRAALETLITNRPADLRAICESLLKVRFLNAVAVRGLAAFRDPAIGTELARNYRRFHHSERPAVIDTLVSRPAFAGALLKEMSRGRIARADLSPFQARQIRSFGDSQLSELLSQTWGEIRNSASDKQQAMAQLKIQLTEKVLSDADRGSGRLVYNKSCANCHRLYGHGGAVGPDLTGSGRHNLDYLLENLVDPSAVVSADYRMSVVALTDGRVLNGIVTSPTERTLTIQTAKEPVVVPRDEIDEVAPSKLSVMPDGLLETLSPQEVHDLLAYLMHPVQVPSPK